MTHPTTPNDSAAREAAESASRLTAERIRRQLHAANGYTTVPAAWNSESVSEIIFAINYPLLARQTAEAEALRKELAELKGALQLGQENCDAVYDDLKRQLDAHKVSLSAVRSNRDQLRADLARLREREEANEGLLSGGVLAIAKERKAHTSREGWTTEHDDTHTDGSLRVQAAINCCRGTDAHVEDALDRSPWTSADKPTVRQLEIAGSLIAAEWDRLNRAALAAAANGEDAP